MLGVPQWTPSGSQVGALANGFSRDIRFSPKTIRPDGKGGALIVWYYFPNPANQRSAQLYIQHLTPDGKAKWQGGKRISDQTFYSQDENFEVVEIALRNDIVDVLYSYRAENQQDSYTVFLKSLSADTGAEVAQRTLVSTIRQPKGLLDDKNNEAVIYYQQGTSHEIQRFSITSAAATPTKTSLFTSDKPNRIDLFRFDESFNVVIGRSETGDGYERVFAHKIARNGTSVWGTSGYRLGNDISFDLQLVSAAAGSTIATWVQKTRPFRSLRAARFLDNGVILWEKYVIDPTSDYFIPNKLISDAKEGALTLWFGPGINGGAAYTLQRIDKDGNLVFGNTGKVMEGWGGFTDYRLLGHPTEGCIALFGASATNGDIETFDLFTNRVNNDGSYGIKNKLSVVSPISELGIGATATVKLNNVGDGFLKDNRFKIQFFTDTKVYITDIGVSETKDVSITIPQNSSSKMYFIKAVATSPQAETDFVQLNVIDPTPKAPVLVATATTYCSDSDVSVKATGCNGKVTWSNGSKGETLTFKITANTTITATCEVNGKKSEVSAAVNFLVIQKPTAIASNTGPYFEGDTIQLNADGGTTYAWTGPNGFISTEKSPRIPASTVQKSGLYNVVVSVAQNSIACSASASTNVVVNPVLAAEPQLFVSKINVFPNPSNEYVSVAFSSDARQEIKLELFTSHGQLFSTKTIVATGQPQLERLSLINATSGVYLMRLSNSKGAAVSKTVVVTR